MTFHREVVELLRQPSWYKALGLSGPPHSFRHSSPEEGMGSMHMVDCGPLPVCLHVYHVANNVFCPSFPVASAQEACLYSACKTQVLPCPGEQPLYCYEYCLPDLSTET